MESTISEHISRFINTKNITHIGKAFLLIMRQKRLLELSYGVYCSIFFKSSAVFSIEHDKDLQSVMRTALSFSTSDWFFSREQLVDIFEGKFAVNRLPLDFQGTRSEGIIFDQNFLIIGEYGIPNGKRLFYVTQQSCRAYDYYQSNKHIAHIHALYKSAFSRDIIITTGDSEKKLDLWQLESDVLVFKKTLKSILAGHTAITKVGNSYYMGTDFSSRPNYIERLDDGKMIFFPAPAYKMFSVAFQEHQNRYILAINKELEPLGDKWALSVFDTAIEKFIYCDYIERTTANKALHRTAIPLRSIAAGDH